MGLAYEGGKGLGFSLDGVLVPRVCVEKLEKVRERINMITSRYGSLSSYGKPPYEDQMEVACVVYLNEKLNVSLEKLSQYLGFSDKTAIYKMVKRIENEGRFTIWRDGRFETIKAKKEELISMVEGEIQARARERIEDLMSSAIVQKFLSSEIRKRKVIAGKTSLLLEHHKKETMREIYRLYEYFTKAGLPNNPDFWTEEAVEKALFEIYKDVRRVREAMIKLRRVTEWSQWFTGRIGAVTKFINPVTRVILFEHYMKVKEAYRNGLINEKDFIMFSTHITCGMREGTKKDGVKITKWEGRIPGLIGIRWEDIYMDVDGALVLKIYESKTEKVWECRLDIIDDELPQLVMKYKEDKGYIMKTLYPGMSPMEVYEHYIDVLEEISRILGLPYTLKPHDIRRSHLSILAEFGVDLVSACSGDFQLGVGWEDLKTAYIFYLRYGRRFKERVWAQIREAKSELLSKTSYL
jgi:biotin operon repressor